MIYIDKYHLELNLNYSKFFNEIYKFPYFINNLIKLDNLYYNNEVKIQNISKKIKYLTNLKELNLSFNKIEIIPKEIQYLTNLKLLNLFNNQINLIPKEIQYLTNLKELFLSDNEIEIISKEIQYLTNLKELFLNINQIEIIPEEIQYLTNLKKLKLYFNKIEIIPKQIQYLTNLVELCLENNKIEIIPKEIQYLTNLKLLDLSSNKIKIIPKEIQYLTNLEELCLENNDICIILKEIYYLISLINLYISNNQIKIIPNEIRYLSNLEELDISNNNITIIPNSIIYCKNLRYFNYENNEIITISRIVTRFLNTMYISDKLHIYNDAQNIHNHSIQESLFNSIINIINQNYIINNTQIINDIIKDTILTEKTKKLLIEYCDNKDIHSKTQLTFEELLFNVWTLINTLDTKDEIKNILNTEINDSQYKCFTGRIYRLVNCLNGFTDLVEINISDNQQIGNIIIIKKRKLELENNYSVEKHKELVIEELTERKFNDKIIKKWINFI
jgi:Leucine-rich repeat (LRR) protein